MPGEQGYGEEKPRAPLQTREAWGVLDVSFTLGLLQFAKILKERYAWLLTF